tara:strand:+ start:11520 stop:12551 length:1032 start_codon:yes stop_codon:yes gene_type:complete
MNKIKIAIIGATGFTGLDLTYYLAKHPRIKIVKLCATKNLGKKIFFLDKRIKKNLPKITSIKKINWNDLDLVFLSLPNGEAQKIIKKTFNKHKHLKYIDLSADFRLLSPSIYLKNYKKKHIAKKLIKFSLYSISEFNKKKIKNFRIISNPGCYPTSIQIPLLPLIKSNLIDLNNITIDSKSGYSGAGKSFKKKFKHRNLLSSTYAYGIENHRHTSEIDQEIKKITKKRVVYTFNPHLIPTFRGMLSSIYLNTRKKIKPEQIRSFLIKYYKNSKFIKITKLNEQIGSGDVLNTNLCKISICKTRIKNKFIIFSAIDNLVKGAAGQAIQNMNIMFGFKENIGLND